MNLIRFKCKALNLVQGNPGYLYRLGEELLENSPTEKNWGILMEKKLVMSQQCAFVVGAGSEEGHENDQKVGAPLL